MTERDYQRALLLARIDAQRTILGLELRLARANFHPVATLLSLLGFDTGVAGTVVGSLRSVLGRRDTGLGPALVPLLVAALLPLVDRLRSSGTPPPDDAATRSTGAD